MINNNFKDRTKLKVIRNEVISTFDTDIRTKRRNRSLVYARAVYYRLCKDLTSHSLAEIGSCLRKDHATVLHGLKVFEGIVFNNDFYYVNAYEEMYDRLKVNYFINIRNQNDLKSKYYRYVNQNINLKEKNQHLNFIIKSQLKEIFKECREEYGYVPQTSYLKEKFDKINDMLEKIS